MSKENRTFADELKKRIRDAVDDSANIASAINVGGKGTRTSVSSRQRVVHRDGVATTTTERRESRDIAGDGDIEKSVESTRNEHGAKKGTK